MTTTSRRGAGWSGSALLERLALGLGAWFVLVYVALALVRLRYPFELEWMEGAVVDQVRQVAAGHKLYVAPSIDFIPFQYPPLYFYAGALLTKIMGVGFLPLRLLSFLSSLGCFGDPVRHGADGKRVARRPAFSRSRCSRRVSARTAPWYDLARIDSLCLLLVLIGGVSGARSDATRRGAIAAGVVLALAFLTKQSALLIALPLFVYLVAVSWREGLAAAAAFAAVAGGATLLLNQLHHGWYVYYVFRMPARMQRIDPVSVDFWGHDILVPLAIAAAMSLGVLIAGMRRARDARAWFYPALALGMIGSAWLSMLHAGRLRQQPDSRVCRDQPPVRAGERGARPPRDLTAALCVVQLLVLFYDPRPQLPAPGSRAAGRHLVGVIETIPGEVLLPQHGYLAALAGKPDLCALDGGV